MIVHMSHMGYAKAWVVKVVCCPVKVTGKHPNALLRLLYERATLSQNRQFTL